MTDQQFMVLAGLLMEIRDELRELSTIVEPAMSEECEHPDEARISLATPGDPFHWICNHCRYEHRKAN